MLHEGPVRTSHLVLSARRANLSELMQYLAECTGRIGVALDCRSDLYSLGVTFFQMLTDTLPFQRYTTQIPHFLIAIASTEPP